MISMVDKQKIIQYWHVEKKSEVEIATELGISRNTVRNMPSAGLRGCVCIHRANPACRRLACKPSETRIGYERLLCAVSIR